MTDTPQTLLEAVRYFSDRKVCFETMLAVKWPDGKIDCPRCHSEKVGVIRSRSLIQCKDVDCRKQFSVKVGGPWEDSPLPIGHWMFAVWLAANAIKITSAQLAGLLGVSPKTAWTLRHRINLAKGLAEMVEYKILTDWPAYRVGDDGSIWTRWRKGPGANLSGEWREMRPSIDKDGYRRIDLHAEGGNARTRKVSVLVCEAWHGPSPRGLVCRHRNGHCQDDRPTNLLWGTTLENTNDRRKHGTIPSGASHGKTKLTDSQIAHLMLLRGTVTQQAAADQFGVSRGYVGQLWKGTRKRVSA